MVCDVVHQSVTDFLQAIVPAQLKLHSARASIQGVRHYKMILSLSSYFEEEELLL